MTVKAKKGRFSGKNKKTRKKPTTDPDRKPTFEQKTDPDPDRLPKVNPAGLQPLSGCGTTGKRNGFKLEV
jgi:hypothetical protein